MSNRVTEEPITEESLPTTYDDLVVAYKNLQEQSHANNVMLSAIYATTTGLLVLALALVVSLIIGNNDIVTSRDFLSYSGMIIGIGMCHAITCFVLDKYGAALFGVVSIVMMVIINSLATSL